MLADQLVENITPRPPEHYQLVVGNIGTVYTGYDAVEAIKDYQHYVNLSKSEAGRAAGESVTLFCDGEIMEEHTGRAADAANGK